LRRSISIIAAALLAVLAGCSSIKIGLDFDPQVDFKRFTTYDWLDNRPDARGEARAPEYPSANEVIRATVQKEFPAKGLTRNELAPDLLVTYYVGADSRIDVTARGYRYRETYGSWSGDIRAHVYREGALVMDLVDAADMSLVWRGTAQDVLGRTLPREQTERNVDEAVRAMLAEYPPAR
jgi:hypothetical protein